MNTVANRVVLPTAQSPITGALAELERRQPQLASVALDCSCWRLSPA